MNNIAVCIVTFNHEKYIAQAIESVLIQKVSVPYKIFIGEDCSVDKTREICLFYYEKYPALIELELNKKNQGLVKNTINLFKKILIQGFNYIAILDGDDYWTDEFKLQKQINFFETDDSIGLIHTNYELLWNNQKEVWMKKNVVIEPDYVFDRIENYCIGNCTVMFKAALLQYINFDDFVNYGFKSCDYVMYVIFSKYSKFLYLNDISAVWRRGHSSVSNPNDIFKEIDYINNDLRMWQYLFQIFPERFKYSDKDGKDYADLKKFNIAFKYGNFEIAHEICINGNLHKKEIKFKIKKLIARNYYLFYFWNLLVVRYQLSTAKLMLQYITKILNQKR